MVNKKKYNLLGHPEKLIRDVSVRFKDKELNREKSLKFDFEYFDGPRSQGYGGYVYDGRWQKISHKLMEKYKIPKFGNFLDVGCAKGFLLHDLKKNYPTINVYGLDISKYAIENSMESIKNNIRLGNCSDLPFEDNFFDTSVAINTIHNLELDECKKAIKELIRVTKNKKNIFIQVDAYENDYEKNLFEIWMLTAKTYLQPLEWMQVFEELKYEGDYFWTNIGFEQKP